MEEYKDYEFWTSTVIVDVPCLSGEEKYIEMNDIYEKFIERFKAELKSNGYKIVKGGE